MKFSLRRKTAIFVIALLAAGGVSAVSTPAAYAVDDFDTARANWMWHITGGAANTSDPDIAPVIAQVNSLAANDQSTMDTSAGRTYLWSDLDNLGTNEQHLALSFSRLREMAVAFQTHGAALRGNGVLSAQIKSAALWLVTNYYNSSTTLYGNWWFWRIGIPLDVNDIVTLLYDQFTPTERGTLLGACQHFSNGSTDTGSNAAWVNSIQLVRAILIKNATTLATAKTNLLGTAANLTNPGFPGTIGEGYYTDGSYLMHGGDPSNGAYAMDHIKHVTWAIAALNGTSYAFTPASIAPFIDTVMKAYPPYVYKGAVLSSVRGRAIARPFAGDHARGSELIGSLGYLASFMPSATALTIDGLIKYWVQNDSANVYANQSIANIRVIKTIMNDASIPVAAAPSHTTLFPQSNRIVATRPDWSYTISMYGGRTFSWETATGENLRGYHTGDGTSYLYNGDGNSYDGNFWPTVDPMKMPGVTLVDGSMPAGRPGNTNYWVGGDTLTTADGSQYGIAGMDQSVTSLVTKKSWFMFDDEIVALDGGVTATSSATDRTVVDNRKLKSTGDNAATITTAAGTTTYTGTSMSSSISGVKTIHLAGNTAGADVGYYFPTPATLDVTREFRTDKWSSIQGNVDQLPAGDPSVTESYFTVSSPYISHPTNASFAYVLLPNASLAQVNAYQATPETTVLRNDGTAQAVSESTLGIVGANFWTDASTTVNVAGSPWITSDKKASVMTQKSGGQLRVSLSDPTQKNTGTVTLEIAQAVSGVVSLGPGVTVIQTSPTLKLSVNVNGVLGTPTQSVFTY